MKVELILPAYFIKLFLECSPVNDIYYACHIIFTPLKNITSNYWQRRYESVYLSSLNCRKALLYTFLPERALETNVLRHAMSAFECAHICINEVSGNVFTLSKNLGAEK